MYYRNLIIATITLTGSSHAWTISALEGQVNCAPKDGTRIRVLEGRSTKCHNFGDDMEGIDCNEYRWTNGRPDGPRGCTSDNTGDFGFFIPSGMQWARSGSGKDAKCNFYIGKDCAGDISVNSGGPKICIPETLQDQNNRPMPNWMRLRSYVCAVVLLPRMAAVSPVADSNLEGLGLFKLPSSARTAGYLVPPVFTDTLLHAAGFIANLAVKSDESSEQQDKPQVSTGLVTPASSNQAMTTPGNSRGSPLYGVATTLKNVIMEIGGFSDQDMDYTKSLDEPGIDSLMQIEIMSKLSRIFPSQPGLNQQDFLECETL
ncbi:polyketide synthase [Fusarium albosuccineum]|uniref:Polyketide synthase n=1 Tax=Fusarium albosuccineum TaxID=1237068 RepID=A0A8H4L3V2_9HYPO|nr:polyketide synthase [Fusarium albosuccineum]